MSEKLRPCVYGKIAKGREAFCGGATSDGCSQVASLYHQWVHGGDPQTGWSSEHGVKAWKNYLAGLERVLIKVDCPYKNKIMKMG